MYSPRVLVPLLPANIPLVHVHQEQESASRCRARKTKHISRLGRHRLVEEPAKRHAHQNGQRLGALHKAPGSREISRPHAFIGVHLQRVVIAAAKQSVDPHKHHVPLKVVAHARQRQHTQAAHESRHLAQILTRDAALDAVAHHQEAKHGASGHPGNAQIRLQMERALCDAVQLHAAAEQKDGRVETDGAARECVCIILDII